MNFKKFFFTLITLALLLFPLIASAEENEEETAFAYINDAIVSKVVVPDGSIPHDDAAYTLEIGGFYKNWGLSVFNRLLFSERKIDTTDVKLSYVSQVTENTFFSTSVARWSSSDQTAIEERIQYSKNGFEATGILTNLVNQGRLDRYRFRVIAKYTLEGNRILVIPQIESSFLHDFFENEGLVFIKPGLSIGYPLDDNLVIGADIQYQSTMNKDVESCLYGGINASFSF